MAQYDVGNPGGLNGSMEIVVGSFEDIKEASIEVKLADILWSDTIPTESIDGSVNVGATSASYKVRDRRGRGAFRAVQGSDAPTVGITLNKVTVPVESASVSATVDFDEARSVSMGFSDINLITDYGKVMREAAERHIERTFFFGESDLNFEGYLDYPNVTATTASTKAGGGTAWSGATDDEIINDIQTTIGSVYSTTNGTFLPGCVELPLSQLVLISSRRVNGTSGAGINETILEFVKMNNIYTSLTGQPLEFKGLRYLQNAGAGSTDRMIVSEKKGENHWLPMPEAFNMIAPQQRGLDTDLNAIYKFGSYHKPFPLSVRYVDGI